MDICFSGGFLSFFTYVILTNVSNGANFCMKLSYFMKEISIFAPKPCILQNLRSNSAYMLNLAPDSKILGIRK